MIAPAVVFISQFWLILPPKDPSMRWYKIANFVLALVNIFLVMSGMD